MPLILSCFISGLISFLISIYLKRKYENYSLTNINIITIIILAILFNLILNSNSHINNELITNDSSFSFVVVPLLFTIVAGCLASSFLIDVLFKELPDENNLLLGVSLFIISLLTLSYKVIFTAIILFIVFFALSVITNQFGMGDVKLMTAMGLGFYMDNILRFVYLSFLFASIYILIKIICKKRKENTLAFGPFLIIGFLVIMF